MTTAMNGVWESALCPSPPHSYTTASVLIPAHNEAETIGRLVRACRNQPYPLERIVVVADACTDNTAAEAWKAGANIVLETDYKDKAGAQNTGLKWITSEVVVGFDGDTIPQPDCITRMMADIEKGKDATCSTILPLQKKGFFIRGRRFSYALGRAWWRRCQAAVGRMQVLTGAAYAFKTAAIRAVGGFPSGLISADMNATWALHEGKYKVGYAAKAVALTLEPETYKVYRSQIRRWAAGYFQNMAKYRRLAVHPRSLLVVGTAIFDLLSLFWAYGFLAMAIYYGQGWLLVRTYAVWWLIHFMIIFGLVARVIGFQEAVMGVIPYHFLNFYNKWVYLCAFGREWILGRHYASWTGRQGRKLVITPMTGRRKLSLSILSILAAIGTSSVVFDGGL